MGIKKVYDRTCLNKECKKRFNPHNSSQTVCSIECSRKYAKQLREKKIKQDQKDWNIEKKRLKEKLKTTSDYLQETQVIFNTFIRLRDKNEPCISCSRPLVSKYDAGHYRSVGSSPSLRFDEMNVHGQCVHCNQHLRSNAIEYRIRLVKKIGVKEVERLEGPLEPKHYSKAQLILMKTEYREKIRILKKV